MKKNLLITIAVVAAFAALAAGSGSSSGGAATSAGADPAAGASMQAEIASKGAAATLRDHLKDDVCEGPHFRTPYIDQKEKVAPFASAHILYGQWIDPGVEGLDSSKNDQVQSLTPDDLGWYGALDALCNPASVCQGDTCELTEPDIYAKTRIEVRVVDGQPHIAAVYKGVSLGGSNSAALETAYATFVTTTTAQLPPATVAAAAAAPPAPPSAPPSGT